MCRRKLDLLAGAIQSDQLSKAIAKMVPMRLGKVIKRMLIEIEAARRHGMQKRLPEMRARFVDERDPSSAAFHERIAQARSKFQSRSTTADDNDFVKCRVFLRRLGRSHGRLVTVRRSL
jgi:hypothetical protein